jgi:hypothetical protein
MKRGKWKSWLPFAVMLTLAAALRIFWACVSQWREDQATNIWLGYNAFETGLPVGLISSTGLLNPNGMPSLGILLSALPNLLAVSSFLSLLQLSLISYLVYAFSTFGRKPDIPALVACVFPVTVCAVGVEFWNQYLLLAVNAAAAGTMLMYLRTPNPTGAAALALLALLAPALYLAGLNNAAVIAILFIVVATYRGFPEAKRVSTRAAAVVVALAALFFAFWVWAPYFQAVGMDAFRLPRPPLMARIGESLLALISFPIWIFRWTGGGFKPLLQSSPEILAPACFRLSLLSSLILKFQAVLFLACLASLAVRIARSGGKALRDHSHVILLTSYLVLSFMLSPLLGGASWHHRRRPDQALQFVPIFYLLLFYVPVAVGLPFDRLRLAGKVTAVLAFVFGSLQLVTGILVVHSYLSYRGPVLDRADVPLIHKMQAVSFIAKDWKERSSSAIVPVDYGVGGHWDWIPKFGRKLEKWYPAPMTTGRSFDYELLRRYGLKNVQEGKQIRTFGSGRYLVTYSFRPAPDAGGRGTHHEFGRIRVTVVGDESPSVLR